MHRLERFNKERLIEFMETDEDHIQLLKRLWFGVFPEQPWQGPVGDHWKHMGMEIKDNRVVDEECVLAIVLEIPSIALL
jgi:hypothetical protein